MDIASYPSLLPRHSQNVAVAGDGDTTAFEVHTSEIVHEATDQCWEMS